MRLSELDKSELNKRWPEVPTGTSDPQRRSAATKAVHVQQAAQTHAGAHRLRASRGGRLRVSDDVVPHEAQVGGA